MMQHSCERVANLQPK